MQFGLMGLTMLGFLLTALKMPEYGLLSNFLAQIFWLYSGYKAWKDANQLGIFISTVFITLILAYGVMNYWFLS